MNQLIKPEILAKIGDLPLVAKVVGDGFLFGAQQGIHRGVGVEFSQYRSYEEGDELSRIDWKLFARSDRYFIREAERESEIQVWFVLDSSASMKFKSENQVMTKFQYAKYMIATMAYIAQRQGDKAGLLVVNEKGLKVHQAASGRNGWNQFLLNLERAQCDGAFYDISQGVELLHAISRRSLIVFISDFYENHDEINRLVQKLNYLRSEKLLFQLDSNLELNFPYSGKVEFIDFETGKSKILDASSVSQGYHETLLSYRDSQSKQYASIGLSMQTFNIDDPLDDALFQFLKSRKNIGR